MRKMKKLFVFLVLFFVLFFPQKLYASEEEISTLIDELDFEEVDGLLDGLPEKLGLESLVRSLAGGEDVDFQTVCDYAADVFFYELSAAKPLFFKLVSMGLLFSLFGRALVTRQRYVSQMGFFVVYSGVLLLLLESFLLLADVVEGGIDRLVSFMTAFVPLYAATLLFAGNGSTAAVFYELAFGLMFLLELGMKYLFLPGIHTYVLLLMMDELFEKTKLSKLAQLIEDGIRLLLKAGFAGVMGIGVVQSLIAPARDRLSVSGIYSGLSAMPGVGNTLRSAAEILTGCGILIKNSVGAAALIVLLVISAAPLFTVFCYLVLYRLTAALLATVCDSRISQCVQAAAKGCSLFFSVQLDAVLLFFLTIAMISASSAFLS